MLLMSESKVGLCGGPIATTVDDYGYNTSSSGQKHIIYIKITSYTNPNPNSRWMAPRGGKWKVEKNLSNSSEFL